MTQGFQLGVSYEKQASKQHSLQPYPTATASVPVSRILFCVPASVSPDNDGIVTKQSQALTGLT